LLVFYPMIPTAAVSGRRPRSWWSDVHRCPICRRSCVSGGWKPPLEQSAAGRWLFFFETASKLISFPDHFLPNYCRFL